MNAGFLRNLSGNFRAVVPEIRFQINVSHETSCRARRGGPASIQSIGFETDRENKEEVIFSLPRKHLHRTERTVELQADLVALGVAQRVEKVAVVEAHFHRVAQNGGGEGIAGASDRGGAGKMDLIPLEPAAQRALEAIRDQKREA